MTSHSLTESIWELDAVDLSALDRAAALQTRKDRKYIVPSSVLEEAIREMGHEISALTIDGKRMFRYESAYFDTPDLHSYLAAAYGRPSRFKVRTRTYMDSGKCLLEVKARERTDLTVKHRCPYPLEDRSRLTAEGRLFIEQFNPVAMISRDLRHTLTVRYLRTTLFEAASASRVTVDTEIEAITHDGRHLRLPSLVIVETKTCGAPSRFDRRLWSAHCRPVKVSKYCTTLAAIDPSLPANKWSRVLRSHFDSLGDDEACRERVSARSLTA
ncbi:MAG: polyphosphate polymerase domain-containing protein [Coriobacteriia bacterium]|nr:polyphosphate polymerase domain-containing protein [Coriobacteriia bacterium]